MHKRENDRAGGTGDHLIRTVISDHTDASLATTVSSIINGGNRVTPHVGMQVENGDKKVIKTFDFPVQEGYLQGGNVGKNAVFAGKSGIRGRRKQSIY